MAFYTYNGTRLRKDRGWTDDQGVQHPSNWTSWSEQEKTDAGLVKVEEDPRPNPAFYFATQNPDGSWNSTPRPMDALKASMKQRVSETADSLIRPYDWMYIRAFEDSLAVRGQPRNPDPTINTFREAVRTHSNTLDTTIDAATTIAELEVIDVRAGWPLPPGAEPEPEPEV